MDRKKEQRDHVLKGIELCEKMDREFQESLKEPIKREAYELSEEASNLVFTKKNYNPEKAVACITRAAELDETYRPRIQAIKNEIERKARKGKVNLKRAINKLFVRAMQEKGFRLVVFDFTELRYMEVDEWKQDVAYEKVMDGTTLRVSIGRTKFGGVLGVGVSKENRDKSVTHIDPKIPDSELEYLNQKELEDVLTRLVVTIDSKLNEWGAQKLCF